MSRRQRLSWVLVAMLSALCAQLSDWPWSMIAAVTAVIVLLSYCFVEFVRPMVRHRRLKRPCRVHFVVREHDKVPTNYLIQDEDRHWLNDLVVPANSEIDIEVGYSPKLTFYEESIIFGCRGSDPNKPVPIKRFVNFIKRGRREWDPDTDDMDKVYLSDHYHWETGKWRNVGTHWVFGFRMQTFAPGTYDVSLSFVTNERQGVADRNLRIIVEEPSKTTMRCHAKGHIRCFVRPAVPRLTAERATGA